MLPIQNNDNNNDNNRRAERRDFYHCRGHHQNGNTNQRNQQRNERRNGPNYESRNNALQASWDRNLTQVIALARLQLATLGKLYDFFVIYLLQFQR